MLPAVQQSGAGKTTLLSMPDDAPAAQTTQNAPIVTYQDGLLTIDARNATLAEVLKLIAEKSGATIEVPPGTGLERIFEHSGPAPAQDVLARLLNGSTYDFIIVSSPQVPHGPAQVLLSLHKADAPAVSPDGSCEASRSLSRALDSARKTCGYRSFVRSRGGHRQCAPPGIDDPRGAWGNDEGQGSTVASATPTTTPAMMKSQKGKCHEVVFLFLWKTLRKVFVIRKITKHLGLIRSVPISPYALAPRSSMFG